MNSKPYGNLKAHFLEADARTVIGDGGTKHYNTNSEKLLYLRHRHGLPRDPDNHDVDYGISIGRGSIGLDLHVEEYQKLRR